MSFNSIISPAVGSKQVVNICQAFVKTAKRQSQSEIVKDTDVVLLEKDGRKEPQTQDVFLNRIFKRLRLWLMAKNYTQLFVQNVLKD